jgi:hypothetical protein
MNKVVEHMPSKVLSSSPSVTKNKITIKISYEVEIGRGWKNQSLLSSFITGSHAWIAN